MKPNKNSNLSDSGSQSGEKLCCCYRITVDHHLHLISRWNWWKYFYIDVIVQKKLLSIFKMYELVILSDIITRYHIRNSSSVLEIRIFNIKQNLPQIESDSRLRLWCPWRGSRSVRSASSRFSNAQSDVSVRENAALQQFVAAESHVLNRLLTERQLRGLHCGHLFQPVENKEDNQQLKIWHRNG